MDKSITQSIKPLIHCSVDNVLIKATPLFNQSFFQMIDVMDLAMLGRSKSCWKAGLGNHFKKKE